MRVAVAAAAAWGALAVRPVRAQAPERFSVDSVIEADSFRGESAVDRPNIVVDVSSAMRIGSGWTAYFRPWLRQPRADTWDKQIYQAAVQYERAGTVSTRLDLGYIASPIGLGLMDTRPGVNPTILPHLSYFTPMPPLEPGGIRVMPIASTYPFGGALTVSGRTWDARGAIVNSAPTRIYMPTTTATNPRATPVFEAGAGLTPKVGLRIGASFAHGDYATREEMNGPSRGDRMLTLVGVEGEYAFAGTSLAGEVTRDTLEVAAGSTVAYQWFVQGMQTLTPRWFAAGRQEGTSAPPPFSGATTDRQFFHTSEATVGYRLSPEVSVRASMSARKAFTRVHWDRQAGVSLVWAHRWW